MLDSCSSCATWRVICNELAGALRPFTMFREQRIQDGKIVSVLTVPGQYTSQGRKALEQMAQHMEAEQKRRDGVPLLEEWRDAA